MSAEKADAFLRRAKDSLASFGAARAQLSRDTAPHELRLAWSQALSEFRKFVRFISEAAKNANHASWAKNLEDEIGKIDCLRYLFHARNADEHGIREISSLRPASLNIGNFITIVGENKDITIDNCGEIITLSDGSRVKRMVNGRFSTRDGRVSDGWIKSQPLVSTSPNHIALGPVKDRGVEYSPPRLGCSPEKYAFSLAQIAENWMKARLESFQDARKAQP